MGRPSNFTQAKLGRAIRAAQEAGMLVARVEIEPTGKIILVLASGEARTAETPNPWDSELA
jgi:hypothetical protein